jgi:small subunit ribosomal protein S7
MRGKLKARATLKPDLVYKSVKVTKFVNYIMEKGKKNIARKIIYGMFDEIKERTKTTNPLEVFELALSNTAPNVEVRSKRVGGANYQVPVEVRPERRAALSMKWIIEAARSKKGAPMAKKLADEVIAASKNEGEAIKKKENTLRMAEANKAFAHFAW